MGKHSRNSSGLFSLSSAVLVIISLLVLGNVMSVRVWELVGGSPICELAIMIMMMTLVFGVYGVVLVSSYEQFPDDLAE